MTRDDTANTNPTAIKFEFMKKNKSARKKNPVSDNFDRTVFKI